MFELKPISKEALPKALEKADRYRLLGEPGEAESICLDVLEVDPDNQRALVILILALTDQFAGESFAVGDPHVTDLLARLSGEYERAYYAGVVCERRAKATFGKRMAGPAAYDWFHEAMSWYEKAEVVRPAGNDDAVLRWNTCARIFNHNQNLQPWLEERNEPYLE